MGIGRAECLRRLPYESFLGSLAFALDGVVEVRPVNYIAHECGLVFSSASGTVLGAAASGTSVVRVDIEEISGVRIPVR